MIEVIDAAKHRLFLELDLSHEERNVFERLRRELAIEELYVGDVKVVYDRLLSQIIHFVKTRSDDGPRVFPYLASFENKDNMPQENALQTDLHSMLCAISQVHFELSGVASGRTDLYLPQMLATGSARFVIETKRFENKRWVETAIRAWLGQTAAYGQTDLRLGFLGILDLSVRDPGAPSLSDCFFLRERRFSDTDVRKVTVFRVPGNQRTPSTFSAK